MPKKKTDNCLSTVTSLDVLLSDLLNQIKVISQDQKDAPYIKLIELFFKGLDLREKIINPKTQDITEPEFNIIKGLDEELI